MEILILIVAVAGLSAAAAWRWLSRPPDAGRDLEREPRLVGFGEGPEAAGDFFVLQPSDQRWAREDRPAPGLSLARLVLAIALSTALLVALAYLIGLLVKMQLDSYFRSGA